jgi:hypothetical protein
MIDVNSEPQLVPAKLTGSRLGRPAPRIREMHKPSRELEVVAISSTLRKRPKWVDRDT